MTTDMSNPFQTREPAVENNNRVRIPQREAFAALRSFSEQRPEGIREVGVVLPVGCGKSGCITLTPFAFRCSRALVVAPGVNIAQQLERDFNPSVPTMFYHKCGILADGPYPEPVEIRGNNTNQGDLEDSHVVITNIQQLQGEQNRWLSRLPSDFFDLIVFDEGHHGVAVSWESLKSKFPAAIIVNFSATPLRADGQIMAGQVIYSFPVSRAIQEGYVKRLKAVQLNPKTLKYVRTSDGVETEVSLDEVRQLGEEDADFRRSIVTSEETLNTIVDASIRELDRLRQETGEGRLKIIASALNFEHCRQIVQAYRSRNLRADYVHSREAGDANARVMEKLANHELDVIVQVRKLGEGFDHPYLSVAAVFSIFSNLSPFVQFVGRIMRVIIQDSPGNVLNQGTVVFHAGANIARRWADFQTFSEADQEYFDQLLPLENFDPAGGESREIVPVVSPLNSLEVSAQTDVELEEISLLPDEEAAIRTLQASGLIPQDFDARTQTLQPVPVTLQNQRRAMRQSLATRVLNEARRILGERGVNPEGRELDRNRQGRTNLITMKAAIDRVVNTSVGLGVSARADFSRQQLQSIDENFAGLVAQAVQEVFDGN